MGSPTPKKPFSETLKSNLIAPDFAGLNPSPTTFAYPRTVGSTKVSPFVPSKPL